jgi:tetratricopeptide (TPR) repeat protein
MNCPRCDQPLTESDRYCARCGLALRQGDPLHRIARAWRLEIAGDFGAAVAEYERLLLAATSDSERAVINKHLGNLHFRLGHLRRAREYLGLACQLEPGHAAFWHERGVVEYHMADLDGAVASLEQALRLDPDLQLARFWLGNARYHRGELEPAAAVFRELIERFPNFTIARFHLGVIYGRQGRGVEADEEFRQVLLKNPGDAAALWHLASRGAKAPVER